MRRLLREQQNDEKWKTISQKRPVSHHNSKQHTNQKVNIKPLQNWVIESLSPSSALRNVVLTENQYLDSYEFLAKIPIWMKLLDIETKK